MTDAAAIEALARRIAEDAHAGQVDKARELDHAALPSDHEGLCCRPAARRAGKAAADAALAAVLAGARDRKAREALGAEETT